MIIPLRNAYWCENCQSVGDDFRMCPGCAATNLVPLSRWVAPIYIQLDWSGVRHPDIEADR